MNWRLGSKVALNVYDGNRPVCQCHTVSDALAIVSAQKQLAASKQREATLTQDRDVAWNALGICECGHPRGAHIIGEYAPGCCDYHRCTCRQYRLTPSDALTERDRAIREDVLSKLSEMEVLLPINHWGGTKKQILIDFHLALIANARREFSLEPKT